MKSCLQSLTVFCVLGWFNKITCLCCLLLLEETFTTLYLQLISCPQDWNKKWEVCSGCLEKFAQGNSQGSSDLPEERSAKGKSDDPRKL